MIDSNTPIALLTYKQPHDESHRHIGYQKANCSLKIDEDYELI